MAQTTNATADPVGAKRIAEFTSALAAVVVVVVSALFAAGRPPFGWDYSLWALVASLLVMAFAFGGGFVWAGRRWQARQAAILVRKYPEMVTQLDYLVTEVFEATSSRRAKINTYGTVAFDVQQGMARATGTPSQTVSEKAGEIINAWATGDGLRESTARTVQARCGSDARKSTAAFCQALEETQQLAASAAGSISSYLYCIRRGFPCPTVGSDGFDNWASFAGRVNQYQDQLSYLIRAANELFGLELSPYFKPVPPWLWLNV